jgi:hypothetical protein
MSTLHEQARALVRDLAPGPFQKIAGWGHALPAGEREAIVQVARGFLAGHEAATRTRVVTTVAELDALPVGSVVLTEGGSAWQKSGTAWYMSTGKLARRADWIQLPARVLFEPEETP